MGRVSLLPGLFLVPGSMSLLGVGHPGIGYLGGRISRGYPPATTKTGGMHLTGKLSCLFCIREEISFMISGGSKISTIGGSTNLFIIW